MVKLHASVTQEKVEAIVQKWLERNRVQGSLIIKEGWSECEVIADFTKDKKDYAIYFIFNRGWGFCRVTLYEVLGGYKYCKQWNKEVDFMDNFEGFDVI